MGGIFYVNSVSFLFVIWALWVIRPRKQEHHAASAGETGWQRMTAGLRYTRENHVVRVLILSTALMTIFAMPYMMLLPAVVDKALIAPSIHGLARSALQGRLFAYVMAANGLGAVFGSLAVAVPCADDGDLRARGSRATHDELAGEHVDPIGRAEPPARACDGGVHHVVHGAHADQRGDLRPARPSDRPDERHRRRRGRAARLGDHAPAAAETAGAGAESRLDQAVLERPDARAAPDQCERSRVPGCLGRAVD